MPEHVVAALGQGQIGFYAAAATAIPVLMLAYLVEMAALATRIAEQVDQFATAKGEDALRRASSTDTLQIFQLLSAAFSGFDPLNALAHHTQWADRPGAARRRRADGRRDLRPGCPSRGTP